MKGRKFNNFLTFFLIIIIILMVGIIGFVLFTILSAEKNNKDASDYVDEFINEFSSQSEEDFDEDEIEEEEGEQEEDQNGSNGSKSSRKKRKTSSTSGSRKYRIARKYKGYDVIGIIRIPKTNVKYPIIEELTVKSLNTSVVAIFPEPPEMNTVGNVVIIGHNNKNRQFFSRNNRLSKGDNIYITGLDGEEYKYKIYKKFQTTADDTSFYTRDTKGKREITLSTCTNNLKSRIIIQAAED